MKSILILEDSNAVAESLAGDFGKRGWNVTSCGDRDRAMGQLAGSDPYTVILLGYSVPGGNGVPLVKFTRGLDHRRMTAIVMVTDSSEVIEEALSAGADEVLLEPIDPAALVSVVDKHFS
jgi:DNA-binding response OmpR family regulator